MRAYRWLCLVMEVISKIVNLNIRNIWFLMSFPEVPVVLRIFLIPYSLDQYELPENDYVSCAEQEFYILLATFCKL